MSGTKQGKQQDIMALFQRLIEQYAQQNLPRLLQAQVVTVNSDNTVKVMREGEIAADAGNYPLLTPSYRPVVGDWAWALARGTTLLILGKNDQAGRETVPNAVSKAENAQGAADAARTKADNAHTRSGNTVLDSAHTKAESAQSKADAADAAAGTARTRADSAQDAADAANTSANKKVPLSGGTITGNLYVKSELSGDSLYLYNGGWKKGKFDSQGYLYF